MKTMLVAIDFSRGAELVLDSAIQLAKALGEQIVIVHVVDDTPLYTMYGMYPEEVSAMTEYRGFASERAQKLLGDARDRVQAAGVEVRSEVLEGQPQEVLLGFMQQVGADMVVVGTHGHSAIGSVLMGSVASGLVRQASVPVLVVPCRELD